MVLRMVTTSVLVSVIRSLFHPEPRGNITWEDTMVSLVQISGPTDPSFFFNLCFRLDFPGYMMLAFHEKYTRRLPGSIKQLIVQVMS
jgi:hypothetical protein